VAMETNPFAPTATGSTLETAASMKRDASWLLRLASITLWSIAGDPPASVYLSNTAITRGKPALTVESGFLGQSDPESIRKIEEGVRNLMQHLKMIPGEPRRVENPVWLDPTQVITSEATGIFKPSVERGHSVAKGTLLGIVTDFFGQTVFEVRAPFAGIVLYIVATPPVSKGEPLAMIGTPK